MNIADKSKLYSEMRRVSKAGGRLAFFDILAGPSQPIHFPVPWAEDELVSFLATAQETRDKVASAGFVGLAGFEPATSCPPDKRANQAALQPANTNVSLCTKHTITSFLVTSLGTVV